MKLFCSRPEACVDYFTPAIIEVARQTTANPHSHKKASHFKLGGWDFLSHKRRLIRLYIAIGDPIIYRQYSSTTNIQPRLLANNRKANLDTLLESIGPDSNSGFSI